MSAPQTTHRKPGDVLDFGVGSVVIHFVEDGPIFFSSATYAKQDDPWLARMTFADFEASVIRTREKVAIESQTP